MYCNFFSQLIIIDNHCLKKIFHKRDRMESKMKNFVNKSGKRKAAVDRGRLMSLLSPVTNGGINGGVAF